MDDHLSAPQPSFPDADLAALPPSRPHPAHSIFFGPEGLRAGWSLLLFFALAAALGWLFNTVAHAIHHPAAHRDPHAPLRAGLTLFGESITFAVLALATWIMSRVERRPFRSYGLGSTPRAVPQFFTGLFWGVFFLSLLIGTLSLAHLLVFGGVLLSGATLARFAAEWFLAFLFVGFAEEFATRGYLQFTLARGLTGIVNAVRPTPHARTIGFWISALFFSFIFGFVHRGNPGESPIGLLSAGLIGLVFCLSLWRTGSLWWAVGFHAAWDWCQTFVYGVADSGLLAQFHLLASHPQGKPLLSGGTTGPEGSIFILAIIALISAVILLTLRQTGWPTPGSRLTHPHDSITPTLED